MKSYLGDSVYAEVNEFSQLVLTTENGFGPSNTVILEPEVWRNLMEYCIDNWAFAKRFDDERRKQFLEGLR